MSGFTKLVPEIVMSSIWNESPEVRCVWIAMLATKDENGYVRGNAASLARIANVSLESAEEAIEKFQLPDPESNTPDNDGRRIQAVPGGWFVLNHALYRGKDYREYEAERKREYRRKHPLSGTRPGHVPDSSASASASVSASEKKDRVKMSRTCPGHVPDSSASASASASASEIKDRDRVQGKGKGEAASDSAGKLTPDNFPERAQAANGGRLTEQQLEAFCDYWTERDPKGRCRFQGERYFELPKRIATWARRDRVAPAAVKPERPIWKDCARRCRHWDDEKRWCSKFVRTEPKSCEQCKEF